MTDPPPARSRRQSRAGRSQRQSRRARPPPGGASRRGPARSGPRRGGRGRRRAPVNTGRATFGTSGRDRERMCHALELGGGDDATTPSRLRAASRSTPVSRACAMLERRKTPCTILGRTDVVDVASAAGEDAIVLDAPDALPTKRAAAGALTRHAPRPAGCLDDALVAGAAAEVARDRFAHLALARLRVLRQQLDGGHQEPRGAEAALEGVAVAARLLERRRARRSSSSPSIVVTSAPSACTASIRHERAETPSTSTVHEPQTPCSQPRCVPVRPSSSRRKSASVRRSSTCHRALDTVDGEARPRTLTASPPAVRAARARRRRGGGSRRVACASLPGLDSHPWRARQPRQGLVGPASHRVAAPPPRARAPARRRHR